MFEHFVATFYFVLVDRSGLSSEILSVKNLVA